MSDEFQKCEGDVREDECPSRASSPLYIGHLDGSCEYVRDIFAFHIFSYCKKMSVAFEIGSNAFEIGSNALDTNIIDGRSIDSLWIVLTDSFHGANPTLG